MCVFFCKEFKGWGKSFTRTEIALSILEAALLSLLLMCLIVTMLHWLACSRGATLSVVAVGPARGLAAEPPPAGSPPPPARQLTCTWVPSHKTKAVAVHYEADAAKTTSAAGGVEGVEGPLWVRAARREGAGAAAEARGAAAALVCAGRVACAAVALSARWALAAAPCVAAARAARGRCALSRGGGAVRRVHEHGGAALLLAAGSLRRPALPPAPLLRYLTAVGERLTMITYAYNASAEDASVLSDSVWVTESARCRSGRNVLCASTLRNASCGWGAGGAGAALLRGRLLLGVAGGARRCGYVQFYDLLNDYAWIHEMLSSEIKDE